MPLLRRQPFHRQKPPPDLRPDEEVFHCRLTNEIFRDYEEFFERIILCNSLVWSCSITGRAGLTYQEAVECEEKALKNLATFPAYLQKPILFLATLTHRSRLNDMNDDVFVFAKDRFFIGEIVDVLIGNERKSCKILRVVPPASFVPEVNGCIVIDSDDEGSQEKPKGMTLKADQYRYVVQERGKSNVNITVPAKQVCRKKGLYTRDKSKLFLKQYCESYQGIWKVKSNIIQKKGLEKCCFADYFGGPMPSFGISESKRKSAARKTEDEEVASSSDLSGLVSPKKKKKDDKKKKVKEKEKVVEKSPKLEEPELPKLTAEEKAAIKEQFKQQKMAEKMAQKEELKKKRMEEMQKKREEKAKEREKKMEEKRIQLEIFKEWNKTRDDMECDDLKVLPDPVPVKTRIPTECFGDAVMVLEFINCFKSLFDLREYFPRKFSFETLEKALLETDHNGTLTDILLMMVTAIFALQEEEEAEEEELLKEDKANQATGMENMDDHMDMEELMETATVCAQIPQLTHGATLRKLPLDSFTLSEIIRLHILASGAKVSDKNVKYRYQQRGGYTSLDDPGLQFRKQEPALMKLLSTESLFDLFPGDKLKILKLLVQQFLTYAATRDTLEDNYDRFRQLKYDLRHFQWSEQRREREEAASRYKRRLEERAKEREKAEQKRQQKIKEMEEKLKRGENSSDQNDANGGKKSKEAEMDDDDDAVSMTEEEKEELRQREEEEDANKKAEFGLKESKMIRDLAQLQHACALIPLGRDRMYRRYWVFQSLPGLYVEDDEEFVSEEALRPVPQNPNSNPFSQNIMNCKTLPKYSSQTKPEDNCNGSDKENESFNTSTANNSINVSNTSGVASPNIGTTKTSLGNISTAENSIVTNGQDLSVNENSGVKDVISISDDEDGPPKLEKEEMNSEEKWAPAFLDSPAVKQIVERPKLQWMFITTTEEFDELISSLNPRGCREGALKAALLEQKNRIVDLIEDCPINTLSQTVEDFSLDEKVRSESPANVNQKSNKSNVKRTSKGLVKGECAQEVLEINLRELLVDLEERIYVGALGCIKVQDRLAWRSAIEKGNYDPQTEDPLFAKCDTSSIKDDLGNADDHSSTSSDTPESVVKDLAKALLQIARALEPKFLVSPLGDSDKNKGKKGAADAKKEKKKKDEEEESDDEVEEMEVTPEKTTMERWEDSILYCTSLAQVFLHLATLEKSIAWAKSALHARCRICRRKGDAEQMLLCDKCDRGHHMYCLKPVLKHVPKGDWFCPDCKPKETKRSPLKKRRKTFTEEEEEEEEKDSSEEEEEDEEEEDSDGEEAESEAESEEAVEDDAENDVCAVCCGGGTLICCDSCPLSYHLECANPPLKKVPRGKWQCQICSGSGRTGKIKLPKGKVGGKKKTTPKSTPTSSRVSSKKSSPRDSPVTVKVSRKRDRDETEEDAGKQRRVGRPPSKLADTNDTEPKHYSSSSRGNNKVQTMKLMTDIVNDLMKHDSCWPFLKPVSKKQVPDYYDIIAIPMDFSTIRNKINSYEYTEVSELISDTRQIFSNCAEYNKKTTAEFKAGQAMSKLFEKRLKECQLECNGSTPPPQKRQRKN